MRCPKPGENLCAIGARFGLTNKSGLLRKKVRLNSDGTIFRPSQFGSGRRFRRAKRVLYFSRCNRRIGNRRKDGTRTRNKVVSYAVYMGCLVISLGLRQPFVGAASVNCRFKFDKSSQLFIRVHNETFPSSRCASAIQIVCPLESIAETQPQLQPALLRLNALKSLWR
jgi:hypothetical protein